MNLPAWVEEYRGRPFERGAAGPDAFDCYGLCCAVLRERWGDDPPALDGVHLEPTRGRLGAAVAPQGGFWREVTDAVPVPGDVLAFLPPGPTAELHVAIVVAPPWMLHARQGHGVHTARYDRVPWILWRIGGVFRPAPRVEQGASLSSCHPSLQPRPRPS